MCNYLYYHYPRQCVCLVSEKEEEYIPCKGIRDYFEQACLGKGSTLKGRKEAFSKMMGIRKFIPVLISSIPVNVFFPTDSFCKDDTIWICYQNVETIRYSRSKACIFFKDGMDLEVDHPRRIRQSMDSIFMYLRKLNHSSQSSQ